MQGATPNKQEETELLAGFRNRLWEVGVYQGLPDWFETDYENVRAHKVFYDISFLVDSVNLLERASLVATANHTARVALDSVVLSDIFGFGVGSDYSHQGQVLLSAALDHDCGKTMGDLADLAEKKSGFSEADRERIKFHVGVSTMFTRKEPKAVIADHHRWQRNSYTPYPPLRNFINQLLGREHIKRTPESITLSKFLGVLDCHDSAATRVNTRNTSTPHLLCDAEVCEVLMNEYARLPIVYQGQKMPKFDMSGKELIHELYAKGVFGRNDPFNPYSDAFSFIRRMDKSQELALKCASEKRRDELELKRERHVALGHGRYIGLEVIDWHNQQTIPDD